MNERILAGVLARPPFVPYDLLVIDRGAEEGVVVGAVVYIAQNHAIGLVSHVYDHTSLVTLFTSPGVETTVYVYGPNVFAYAYGEGGGVLRVSLPQGVGIHEGDPVVLPALRMGDVGLIERVESLPTQPEQSAYVTLPQSLQSIRMVSIDRETLLPPTYTDIIADSELLTRQTKMLVPESALQVATSTIDGVGTTTSTTVSTIP